MTTAYLSGPWRNLPHYNFQTFEDAKCWLTNSLGWEVISPHDYAINTGQAHIVARYDFVGEYPKRVFTSVKFTRGNHDKEWFQMFTTDIAKVDRFVLLPHWQISEGAVREALVAIWMGLPFSQLMYKDERFSLCDVSVTEGTLAQILAANTKHQAVFRAS